MNYPDYTFFYAGMRTTQITLIFKTVVSIKRNGNKNFRDNMTVISNTTF